MPKQMVSIRLEEEEAEMGRRYVPSYARMCHTGAGPIVRPMSIEKAIEHARESAEQMADWMLDGFASDDPRMPKWEKEWKTEKAYRKAQGGYAPEGDVAPVLAAYHEAFEDYIRMAVNHNPEWFTPEHTASLPESVRRIVEAL